MTRPLSIEVGCGNIKDLRFDTRFDIVPSDAVTVVGDMRNMSMFSDNTFGFLKAAAVIEHVYWPDQNRTVQEFHRILIPHGIVWVQTPDWKWVQDAYHKGEITEEWYHAQINGGRRDEYDYHMGLLTIDSLELLMVSNGFKVLQLQDGHQASGSLDGTFEAVK